MRINYDKVYNILYVRFERSRNVVMIEDENDPDILYAYDVDTKKIVGITVMNLKAHGTIFLPGLEGISVSQELNDKIGMKGKK